MTAGVMDAVKTMVTVVDAMNHINMPGDESDAYGIRGTLLATLGAEADTPLEDIGFVPDDTFSDAIKM